MGFSGKVYGDTNKLADRILTTFQARDASTGVCLAGEKGSGKTLLAKRISILAAERENIATIVINSALCGDAFNQFVQMIEQPCVMLFDEFEKVYHTDANKTQMLTLLDGVYPSKKLFVMTCNNKYALDVNMRNRPGRFYYMLDFGGVDAPFIREYCQDTLIECDKNVDQVCTIAKTFSDFNFDMLKAMVEEMNRYKESPVDVLRFLNVQPNSDSDLEYTMRLFDANGTIVKFLSMHYSGKSREKERWHGNPLHETITVFYRDDHERSGTNKNEANDHVEEKKDDEDQDEKKELTNKKPPTLLRFTSNDLVHMDDKTNSYIYVNGKNGYRLSLTRVISLPSAELNLDALMRSKGKKTNASIDKMLEAMGDNSIDGETYDDDDDY